MPVGDDEQDDEQDEALSRAIIGSGRIRAEKDLRKPNWRKWGEMVEAEVDEAVALSCDIAPEAIRVPVEDGPHLDELLRRIAVVNNHIGASRLPIYQRAIEGKLATVVRLSEFYAWAKTLGWPVPSGFRKAQATGKPSGPVKASWPWGAHETKLLRDLAAAAERFWAKGYDPEKAPTNEKVVEWLEGRGVSERNAKAIATILRADNIPHGPRRKQHKP